MKTNRTSGICIGAIITAGTFFLMSWQKPAEAQPGTVSAFQKISQTQGNFTGALDDYDLLGWQALTGIGDLDGDGVPDIAAGAPFDDDGGPERGAVWLFFLNRDGTVRNHSKISSDSGNFAGQLNDYDMFGHSIASLGDLDGDGAADIAVGAIGDDAAAVQAGAIWILFLNKDGTVKSQRKVTGGMNGFTGTLDVADWFGHSVANAGDVNGDGVTDLAAGARFDDDGGPDRGALWLLFLNKDGTVKSHSKISSASGGFTGIIMDSDYFGWSVASAGDVNNDGIPDIAAGAPFDDEAAENAGAVWLLLLNADGTVKTHQKITSATGGFTPALNEYDLFGGSLTTIADLNGDKVPELAAGAYQDDDGGPAGSSRGALWILFLRSDATVGSFQKISQMQGNFGGVLDPVDGFGSALAATGDINGDGLPDLAAGAYQDDDGGSSRGALWLLFLNGVQAGLQVNFTVSDVSCYGGSDGAVTAIPSGGAPPYNFLWSNWNYGPALNGVIAGTYFVMVIDGNNTVITDSVQISQPEKLLLSQKKSPVSCHGMMDGTAEVLASGGTPPYRYLWSNGNMQSAVGSMQGGSYTVTVTDNAGCSDSLEAAFTDPAELLVDTVMVKGVSSAGAKDGEIKISLSGGTPPYTYAWSNGAASAHIMGLSMGNYAVSVTDAHGCTMQMSFVISGISGGTETLAAHHFRYFPNPVKSDLTVEGRGGEYEKAEIEISDLRGRLLYRCDVRASGGTFQKRCDLSFAEEGMYLLTIKAAQQVLHRERIAVVR